MLEIVIGALLAVELELLLELELECGAYNGI